MLVLSRKLGERIRIGDDITIVVSDIRGGQVRIGIDAPKSVGIYRVELLQEEQLERRLFGELAPPRR
jgi:carbon storage regulator